MIYGQCLLYKTGFVLTDVINGLFLFCAY